MRITGGQKGGLPLISPNSNDVRPTQDRVRQALFSILGNKVLCANVLDMFAGTGSLGIEALSRGAESAIFVEKNQRVVRDVRENLTRTGFDQETWDVIAGDLFKRVKQLYPYAPFDLIFIDPPYESRLYQPVLELIMEQGLLKKDGWVILEYSIRQPLPLPFGDWRCLKKRTYGETALDIWLLAISP
jgi:16S rRNA (guanine966-N2)-methyltransferase